ncbi:MAG: hypothetical protein IPN03_19760 [Holophagales bacterium]|nr:hypothetical protein [Holophagales bacterium]
MPKTGVVVRESLVRFPRATRAFQSMQRRRSLAPRAPSRSCVSSSARAGLKKAGAPESPKAKP